ncbi:c-type cytochrome [Achromobacter aloeverae]|uniref:Cytochrome c n=1 Tax=Achromobacter aloeverae TaxID=1750518 RepID=A0A4Q1HMV8_9BURK|nr:cytochrome c [Achromobacter aloeverae]RXN92308.1 cytochrome c [Achromobacter aloeverae]
MRGRIGRVLALVAVLASAGCERAAQNMYDQPRGKPYKAGALFPDGAMSRTPPPGTEAYARGSAADTSSGREGTAGVERDRQARAATALPDPVTPAMLRHGQALYGVYCLPCHSPAGDGDGRIVERGFPAPPSYHSDRLREAPDRHFYDVISNGYGVMAAYGNRIEPADRWAIVAFVRALQLSQHAVPDRLPPALRGPVREGLAQAAVGGSDRDGNGKGSGPDTPASPAASHGAKESAP